MVLKRIQKTIKNSIQQSGFGNLAIFKSKNVTVKNVQALDQLGEFIRKGQLDQAAELLNQMNNFLNNQHPGYPYYKYEFSVNEKGQQVISHVPAFPGAEKIMPIKGSMSFRVPENYKQFRNLKELLNYSYGMQQEIELDLDSFKTWIGERALEEFHNEENNLLKVKMIPSKFPPPSPMKLYTKDNSWSLDYLIVGVKEINGTKITFDNSEQSNASFKVVFSIDLQNMSADFNIAINDVAINSVEHILKFKELVLISEKNSKPQLALKLLEQDADILVAKQWKFNENDSGDTKEFVGFLRKLYEIEQHTLTTFKVPERVLNGDEITLAELIFNSMNGKYYRTEFKGEYIIYLDNEADIQKLFKYNEETPTGFDINLNLIDSEPYELFGVKLFPVNHNVCVENIKLADPSRLHKLNELREKNQPLKIKIIPEGENSFFNEMLEVTSKFD